MSLDETVIVDTWWMRLVRVVMHGSTLLVLILCSLFAYFDFSDHPHDYGYGYHYTLSFEPNYQSVSGDEEPCSYQSGAVISKDNTWVRFENSRQYRSSGWVEMETGRRLTELEFLELERRQNDAKRSIECGDIRSVNDLLKYYARVMAYNNDSFPESVPLTFVEQEDGSWVRHNSSDGRRYTKKEVDTVFQKVDGFKKDFENNRIRVRRTRHYEIWPVVMTVGKTSGIVATWYILTFIAYKTTLFIVYGHTKVMKRVSR